MAVTKKSGVLKYVNRNGDETHLYPDTKKVENAIGTVEELKINTDANRVVDALVVKDINARVDGVVSRLNGIEFQITEDGKLQYRYDQEVWN